MKRLFPPSGKGSFDIQKRRNAREAVAAIWRRGKRVRSDEDDIATEPFGIHNIASGNNIDCDMACRDVIEHIAS